MTKSDRSVGVDASSRQNTAHESMDELTPGGASPDSGADGGEEGGGGGERKRGRMFYLHGFAFLFGAALLIFVIQHVGVELIFQALSQIGLGFLWLLGIICLRHALRALALWVAVPPLERHFNLWQAFTTRIGGEAITFLTFTGPVLGEATKAALLKKRVPLSSGVQALVVDNLLYNLSVALFISSGACVMLATYDLPDAVRYPLILIAAGMALASIFIVAAVVSRHMPLSAIVDMFIRRGLKRRWLSARREKIRHVEGNVYDFYKHRHGAFFGMIGCDLLSHATSVLEVFVILRMLGFETGASVAYIIDSLTKVINLVFGFVPATIGVYEGGTGFILNRLGYAAAVGVTLGIVRKAGMIVWACLGLVVLARHAIPGAAGKILERHPRLREAMDNLVLSNISHRPARTLVSVLGVGIGVLLIVFTVGLAHGVLRERGRREADVGAEILIRASGSTGLSGSQPFALPVARADEIAKVEGVRVAVPVGQNTVGSDTGFGLRIIDGIVFERYAQLNGLKIIDGRSLGASGDEAIVDSVWKEQRKVKVGDPVKLYDRDFRIVGIYEPPGGGRIKVPLKTVQEQVGTGDNCTAVFVACDNPAEQDAVAARIHERFPDDQIIFTRDLPEMYASGVPALNVFINVIVGVAAAISMLVILLAMYTTVTERTRQIGVLKALGMSNGKIAWVIEQEALLVSVLGVVVGVLLTLAARFFITRMTSLTVDIEPRWIGISLLIGVVGGTLGALYPALRAARQDAVEALSYE
ncbi:MAG: flippase-like domain-containing protein [Acidobacteria bacterium]|nr:flippase-like domain-containing protein [Acidobacteriota bacterium]